MFVLMYLNSYFIFILFNILFQLYETVRDSRKDDNSIKMIQFERKLRYGHKFIFKAKNLPNIIS